MEQSDSGNEEMRHAGQEEDSESSEYPYPSALERGACSDEPESQEEGSPEETESQQEDESDESYNVNWWTPPPSSTG
jgi:hypothetical protein